MSNAKGTPKFGKIFKSVVKSVRSKGEISERASTNAHALKLARIEQYSKASTSPENGAEE